MLANWLPEHFEEQGKTLVLLADLIRRKCESESDGDLVSFSSA